MNELDSITRKLEPKRLSHLLIADDHAIFAEAMRVYLEKTHTVVGLVRDGHAMVAEAMRLRPDVIVVDVGMPLLNGLDAARKINLQALNIKFIFLTMHDDPGRSPPLGCQIRESRNALARGNEYTSG